MKKIIPIIILVSIITSLGWSQGYRERVRQNVISKLSFYFIEDPTRPFPSERDLQAMEVNKTAIANNQDITGALWTDANNAGLKNLLKKVLRRESQGGEFRLQQKINNVLLITNKRVMVFLFADYNNPTFHSSWRNNAPYCEGGDKRTGGCYVTAHNKASWPCAAMWNNTRIAGDIGLGAYFYHSDYTDLSDVQKLGTIVHELVHTQLSLGNVVYGPDSNHYAHEMIPEKNSAFDEGLANAFEFTYYLPNHLGMTAWFNDNKKLFVDNWPGCRGDQCLQTRLTRASVTSHTCPTRGYPSSTRCYNIRDIPPDFLHYCENTTANILYQYMKQFSGGEYMLVRDIRAARSRMASAPYAFGPLFKQMVRRGMNYSMPNRPSGTVTHGQFLPVGILDYYGGYDLDSKAELGRVLGSNWTSTDTNINDYFGGSNQRNILHSYRSDTTNWHVTRQISRFARHLNVRPSQTPASGSSSGGN